MTEPSTLISWHEDIDIFLRMDARGVDRTVPHGGGVVNCQFGANSFEKFTIEQQRDGTVAIGSTAFPGRYIRTDGKKVNCQHGIGPWERFIIERRPDGDGVSLASAAFPGVYLSMDCDATSRAPDGVGRVGCSRKAGAKERFVLITAATIHDDLKREVMLRYAPLVVLAKDEEYFPSSVEFAFKNMVRFRNDDDGGRYWIRTKQTLTSPSDYSPKYFAGQHDLSSVPAYAYWVDKPSMMTDIVYYCFFPYNRGKSVADTVWGNHVSDWEHATVRLLWSKSGDSWVPKPHKVALSAHDGGEVVLWQNLSKFQQTEHPVMYSARGSHGFWSTKGNHVYRDLWIAQLVDHCSSGAQFATWDNLMTFDYTAKRGLKNGWPGWMSRDFKHAGQEPTRDPANGPIYRWGNEARGCDLVYPDLPCRLENGPEGPVSKDVWKLNNFE